jgi:glycerol-3-phosphate acyltransferase PlsX
VKSREHHIRIAVDAMGGDYAPANVVAGVCEAIHEAGDRLHLVLVGPEDSIRAELRAHGRPPGALAPPPESYSIVHAPEVIDMHDLPTAALKTKRKSSIGIGLHLQKDGQAEAFVSAGNTGAVLSAATLILGRIHGIGRPTIGAMFPTALSPCLLVDAGTNVDCRPQHLLEFAMMGSIYVSATRNLATPRIGLLSIGEEDTKGNEASLAAMKLLRKSGLNFVGNVEGRDVLSGDLDVVVCDGFVGNILLKFGESIPHFLKTKFKAFADVSIRNKVVGLLVRNALRQVLKDLDYQEHGGVPLLGVNGVAIIGHGKSTPLAIKNMIYRAEEMVLKGVNKNIQDSLASINE